jgi:hypothetical protein
MLRDFGAVVPRLEACLASDDPWERYWGLIVCSAFGHLAGDMTPAIREMALADPELINRVRAAEFLGITKTEDPGPFICQALYRSHDPAEALLMLNSVVLLQDGHGYSIEIELDKMDVEVIDEPQVKRRLQYLDLI